MAVDDSTLCKLQFVLSLVRCVLDLAESRRRIQSESAMSTTLTANENDVQSELSAADNAGQSEPSAAFTVDHACFLSNSRCHLEQLVLYIRALQILSSAIQLARIEEKAGKLTSSDDMKNGQSLSYAFYVAFWWYAKNTLSQNTPNFISPELWPPTVQT